MYKKPAQHFPYSLGFSMVLNPSMKDSYSTAW